MIHQGAIYRITIQHADDIAPQIPHPYVVIQPDDLNHEPTVETVVMCGVTTNRRKISYPGNLVLEAGEGNLPKLSIVEVSKVVVILKSQLTDYIGTLPAERVDQILAGIKFVNRLFYGR